MSVGTRGIIQGAIILLAAIVLGVNALNLNGFNVLSIFFFAVLTTMFLMGFAVFMASRAPNVEVFQSMIMPISMPLQFLSPVMYPLVAMPEVLQALVKLNPLTFGVEGLLTLLFQGYQTVTFFDGIQILKDNFIIVYIFGLGLVGLAFLIAGSRAFLRSLAG